MENDYTIRGTRGQIHRACPDCQIRQIPKLQQDIALMQRDEWMEQAAVDPSATLPTIANIRAEGLLRVGDCTRLSQCLQRQILGRCAIVS